MLRTWHNVTGAQMAVFKKSENDVHGFVPYSIGLAAIVVTITCVAGASVLNQVAQNGNLPVLAWSKDKTLAVAQAKPATAPRFNSIDRTATGSIDNFLAHPVLLDPCTGKEK